jgi:hypothetical protein
MKRDTEYNWKICKIFMIILSSTQDCISYCQIMYSTEENWYLNLVETQLDESEIVIC